MRASSFFVQKLKGHFAGSKYFFILMIAVIETSGNAEARILAVGPDAEFKRPSDAVAVAADGDVIEVAPGEYFDCAIIRQNQLVIEGTGAGAVLTDRTCEGKALLIAHGGDLTIRNLTFARARVPGGNGAGIRVERGNLAVEHSRFIDNETGILVDDLPRNAIRVSDSVFEKNGRCEATCAHGINVGQVALLSIDSTRIAGTRGGHHIKSGALRTELIGDDIEDGPDGTASFLVELPNGGDLLMEKNRLQKGPRSTNPQAAVVIDDGETQLKTKNLVFLDNKFANETGGHTVFLRNFSDLDPIFNGNVMSGDTTGISSRGYLLHKVREVMWETKGYMRSLVQRVRALVK